MTRQLVDIAPPQLRAPPVQAVCLAVLGGDNADALAHAHVAPHEVLRRGDLRHDVERLVEVVVGEEAVEVLVYGLRRRPRPGGSAAREGGLGRSGRWLSRCGGRRGAHLPHARVRPLVVGLAG